MDLSALTPVARDLHAAFVAAFPGYLTDALELQGIGATATVLASVEAGGEALADDLAALLAIDPREQFRSPLEVVRMAVDAVATSLQASGIPVRLDPLYPVSSSDLGEEAFQAHVAWGLEKARLVASVVPAPATDPTASTGTRRPAVAWFGSSAEIRDRARSIIAERGLAMLVWRNPGALERGLEERPVVVVVDLDHPAANDAIRRTAAAGLTVIAFGTAIDDFASAATMALGAREVVESKRLLDRLPGLLPRPA